MSSRLKKSLANIKIEEIENEEASLLAELEIYLQQEEYEQAERNFYSFFRSAWSYFDPDEFKDNWHLGCLCEHAQAAVNRDIRRLLVTIPPRSSKCLKYDTEITMIDGSKKQIKDIEIGEYVQSSDLKDIKIDRVIDKIYSGSKPLYRLKLTSGHYLDLTENHRIYSWNSFKTIKDLNIGDPITVTYTVPSMCYSDLTKDEAFLLALWLAEGTKSAPGYAFTNTNIEVINRAKEIADRHNLVLSSVNNENLQWRLKYNPESELNGKEVLVRYGIREQKTNTIRIPREVFSAKPEVIGEFIGTYIACDGWVSNSNGNVGITSISSELIKDLQHLFARLGIRSLAKETYTTYQGQRYKVYNLTISTEKDISLLKEVTYIYGKHEKLYKKACKTSYRRSKLIPPDYKSELLHPMNTYKQKANCSIEKNGWVESTKLERLTGNLHWEKIESIEYIGEEDTYDIETENYNCFFANGILSHNSSIFSVALPTWIWGPANKPQEKLITASYGSGLYTELCVKSRQLMGHPWYKSKWIGQNKVFTMRSDSNTKTRIDNDKFGYRVGTSPGGIGQGIGYSICIVDDPLNGSDATSKALKQGNIDWYKGVLKNRANDSNTDVMIVVAQRLAEDDLPGYLLEHEAGNWFHLNIAMECERKYTFLSPINFNDPRKEGEVLDPVRFPDTKLAEEKLDPFKYATLFQQRPAPPEGGLIKRDWIEWYLPSMFKDKIFDMMTISADLSMTDSKTSDYSVFTVWGRDGKNYYLLDMIREKMAIDKQLESFRFLCNKYPNARNRLVENKANGPALIKMLDKEFGIIPIEPKDYGGSKEARLAACIPEFMSHSVWFPNANECEWIKEVLGELLMFPRARHDDFVDSLSQALNWMALNRSYYSLALGKNDALNPRSEASTIFTPTPESAYHYKGIRNSNRAAIKSIFD